MGQSENFRIIASESVSSGHPDKLADQISDALLDEYLRSDPEARVALDGVLLKNDMVVVSGEVTATFDAEIDLIVRRVLSQVGYSEEWGLDPETIRVIDATSQQDPEIAEEVFRPQTGAGDQGLMFGYACQETPEMMPLSIFLANRIMQAHHRVRMNSEHVKWLGPDAKTQVSLRYDNRTNKPIDVSHLVLSTQCRDISPYELRDWGHEFLFQVFSDLGYLDLLTDSTEFIIRGFRNGGPQSDSGLTGRKIQVDTYGGIARHGGGAFSGKDPTKVDRSAAYMARLFAKSICASENRNRVECQVVYALGRPDPLSVHVHGMPQSQVDDLLIRFQKAIQKRIDWWDFHPFSPDGMITALDLQRPIYQQTATFGHFGRMEFPWEHTLEL